MNGTRTWTVDADDRTGVRKVGARYAAAHHFMHRTVVKAMADHPGVWFMAPVRFRGSWDEEEARRMRFPFN